ncbi:MAG: hypothetical protein COS89_09045 [Deltaproteobacteria bacterium CG07_land_8_20_14_0_80_38_7]|nr:MAG: hypothetical protein COS89_09045 [Deltaproteobacteria bacterium CG07_land_8_20_14_0_80_38_7]
MKKIMLILVLVAFVAVALVVFQSIKQDTDNVIKTNKEDYRETHYSIKLGSCNIDFTTYQKELDRDLISIHDTCSNMFLEQKISFFRDILKRIFKDEKGSNFNSIFYGDFFNNPELSEKLAIAAHEDKGWNKRTGKAMSGDSNAFIEDLINTKQIYNNLELLFKEFNLSIKVSSVEKVLARRAYELSYYNSLQKQGIDKKEILPFHCLTWFSIKPIN